MPDAIINEMPTAARVLRFEDYLQRHSTARTESGEALERPFGRPAGAALLNMRQLAHRRVMLRFLQERRNTP
jgi:hypothetical protein